MPGAPLAAAIFALHPVQVESVAWMTEQKNTLSAVFYLSAALAYLHFDRTRNWQWYAAAAALFLMALLSKTVTGTLPAALLVVFWWQRGRLSWRNDVLPLAPLLLLGAGFAAITAWWELDVNRCTGPEFAFTPVQRLLIAGRTVWFCCGKLFWPAHLTFIYPRWRIDCACRVAIRFSPFGGGGRDAGLVGAAVVARPAGGRALLRRNARAGAWLFQSLHFPLFLRRRPLSVPGMSGNLHALLGRCGSAAAPRGRPAMGRGGGCLRRDCPRAGGPHLAAERNLRQR